LTLPAAVVTFDDHPHGTLAPSQRPPRLATPAQCLQRMRPLGMDEVFLIRFTRQLADTPAETFVRRILVERLGVRHLVIGHDFVFGKGGKGNVGLLRTLGRELGFRVTVVPALRIQRQVVSSSTLRRLVADGRVGLARKWLGWPYTLHGQVRHGEGRGSDIGMPTANLHTLHEIIPRPGIYAVLAGLSGRAWPSLCYIGCKPTFHDEAPLTIEVYIPGWRGPLYGRRLEVEFLEFLRPDRRFKNAEALLRQVEKDWQKARQAWPRGLIVPPRLFQEKTIKNH
jgi:riboflavin kinase/FMN adenylyltransferase